MKRAPRSRQRHDLYAKYHDYDSEISDLLGECGFISLLGIEWRISDTDLRELVSGHGIETAHDARACCGRAGLMRRTGLVAISEGFLVGHERLVEARRECGKGSITPPLTPPHQGEGDPIQRAARRPPARSGRITGRTTPHSPSKSLISLS